MGVTWKLALNYIKNNKKRCFIIGICILISTILITTILLLIDSYREFMIASERYDANWEVGYDEITYEEAQTIEKHSNVKEISIRKQIGEYINEKELDEEDYFYMPKYIIGCDQNALNNLVKNRLEEGRLPENSNEVVAVASGNQNQIGDTIILKAENEETKKYTVVGRIANYYNEFFSDNDVITLLDRSTLKNTDRVDITILSNDISQIYNDYYDIYYQLGSYRNENGSKLDEMVKYNKTLLEYANVLDYTSDFQKNIYTLEGIFIGIIVISSMVFIYSVINISIIERKRYFGILKSIGATTKQMKRSIRIELLILLIIAIPLGIVIGIGLDFLIIALLNNVFPEIVISHIGILNIFEANEGFRIAIPISTIGLTIIIMILTVYISSVIPIKKVTRLQAINSIKQNKEHIKIRKPRKNEEKKKEKAYKYIERTLAFKNIERYKVRYSAIIMSLIVSIILIIVSEFYILNISANAYDSGYNYMIDIDYEIDKYGDLTEKIIDDVQEAKIADKVIADQIMWGYSIVIDRDKISDAEKEVGKKVWGENYDMCVHFDVIFASDDYDVSKILDTYYTQISIITLNDDAYNAYLKEIGVDGLEKNECIFVDYINEKTKYYDGIRITNYQEGEELEIISGGSITYEDIDEKRENAARLKIKKITDKMPSNLSSRESGPAIIAREDVFDYIYDQIHRNSGEEYYANSEENRTIYLKVDNIEAANKFAESIKEKYNLSYYDPENGIYNNIIAFEANTSQEELDKVNLLIHIFVYSFIGIITLVGLLNMYNAINANLETRKREVVSLITIGMEKKQINKMLLYENAITGVLALILGVAIGLLASYIIYVTTMDYWWYAFEIPYVSLIICTMGITAIIFGATAYLKKKIFSDNLIDVLKREET